MAKSLQAERKDVVLDLYVAQGLSATAIERQTGISTTAIYNILRKAGISPSALRDSGERTGKQGGYHRLTPALEQQLIDEYANGASYTELAEKHAISRPAIRRCLQRNGRAPRRKGSQGKQVSQDLGAQILADWNNGMSQHAIGLKYHIHQTTISNILQRWGMKPERRNLRGARHGSWKSGRIVMGGYDYIKLKPTHPWFVKMTNMGGYVAQHRMVMAEFLGRPLDDHETVHHKDGNKRNNILDNLQLRQGNHGKGVVYHCADCGSFNVVAQALADAPEENAAALTEVSGTAYARAEVIQNGEVSPTWPVAQLTLL